MDTVIAQSGTTKFSYTTNIGDFVIMWLTGSTNHYVAEVIQADPLKLKLDESQLLSNLKSGDYIINSPATHYFQAADSQSFELIVSNKGVFCKSPIIAKKLETHQLENLLTIDWKA